MAVLDLERNVVVIRIVYDGPPEAGKTTSLRALAGSLKQPLFTPEENDGRTLFFDWMDYTAGRFEGKQIRCQIVSVPGQRKLSDRRHRLLRDADVIVFVADSARRQLDTAMTFLAELPGIMEGVPGPPVGVIVQANKRDLPDAVPMPELRARLERAGARMAVQESIAADGSGIRETFIFGVRLALDRVRELLRQKNLAQGTPELDSGEALLDWMKQGERGSALAAPALEQVLAENAAPAPEAFWDAAAIDPTAVDQRMPRPPDPSAPSGAIWPPVEGRMILHEAAAGGMTVHRLRNGDWAAGIGSGWRAYTSGGAVFRDVDGGRTSLISWARLHVSCAALLSPRRCVVLADAGDGSFRLWQVVRSESSLRDFLEDVDERPVSDAAGHLLEAAMLLLEMDARLAQAGCPVPCTIDTIGRADRGPIYIGLMPPKGADLPLAPRGPELLRGELEPLLAGWSAARRQEILAAVRRIRRPIFASRHAEAARAALGELLAGHEDAPRRFRLT